MAFPSQGFGSYGPFALPPLPPLGSAPSRPPTPRVTMPTAPQVQAPKPPALPQPPMLPRAQGVPGSPLGGQSAGSMNYQTGYPSTGNLLSDTVMPYVVQAATAPILQAMMPQTTRPSAPRAAAASSTTPGVSTQSAAVTGVSQITNSSPRAFVQGLLPAAQQVSQETGIPYQVLLAIPANETGWGQDIAGNNLYGIKGDGPEGSVNSPTWEVVNGQVVNTNANFRAYSGPEQSMRDFAQLILTSPRYAQALPTYQQTGDLGAFMQVLQQGGYATDPDWANKIVNIAGMVDQFAGQ